MANIYEMHDKAFEHVSAYVVMRNNERVATVAFKFPRDGAGRLYAYVHWVGVEMVRGFASGGGYDKRSAACSSAAHKMASVSLGAGVPEDDTHPYREFYRALTPDDGYTWDQRLRDVGFDVWQAV